MRGRAFIGVLGGAAAWPLAAHTQPNRVRRVGVLMGYAETDPTALAFLAAFKQGLAALGWSEGKNLYIEVRWTAGDVSRAVSLAKELVALQPDAILANTTPVARSSARLRPSPLYSWPWPTLSAVAYSKAWRILAAISPAFSTWKARFPKNASNYLRRSHRAPSESPSCSIRKRPLTRSII
jgi:hypothetical protein